MIRAENFAASTEDFAAERKDILDRAEDELRPHIKDALSRVGLPSWQLSAVDAALDVFDRTARSEVDAWGPVLDDMRDLFAQELGEALKKTKRAAPEAAEGQLNTITRWISTMAVNAGTEAATTSDTDSDVGLEWITMSDSDVRHSHKDANGQTVPTGSAFEVAGEKLMYPGQPVGDPSVWINCRCVVRPVMLSGFAGKTITASVDLAEDQVEAEVPTSTVIVALPAEDDPISAASSEESGAHATLLFLGDSSELDEEALKAALENFVTGGEVGIITERTNGRAVLGKDAADVVLFDAANLVFIREGLLEDGVLAAAHDSVEQFPTWLPHVTLGYPDAPALAEYTNEVITFDRLALWHGESRTEYQLGGAMPEKKTVHPEDPDFTQEMADTFAAGAPDETDVRPSEEVTVDEEVSVEDQEQAEAITEGEPWFGVLAPEGVPSGDGRAFAANALSARELPLPIKYMPIDDEGHKGSFVVGRIDRIWRENGLIKAEGVFDTSAGAMEAARQLGAGMFRGVSVDLDKAVGAVGEDGESVEFSTGRISSATLCAIPAFAEAFIALGTWADNPDRQAPGEMAIEDAPALVASAATLTRYQGTALSADAFRDPHLDGPTPLTVTDDGRVFGHVAAWGTCHIGYEVCTTAPSSMTDYAYFLTGEVFTDAGPVAVGQISLGGGHANGTSGLRAAVSHYDSTSAAAADVTVGEDEHGIWFAGLLRDGLTEAQVRELRAAALSGDWRTVRVGGKESYEMVAALAVNVPGFPIPRASFAMNGGRQMSLLAAGIVTKGKTAVETVETFAAKPEIVAKHVADVAKLRSAVRATRVASLKNKMSSLKGN